MMKKLCMGLFALTAALSADGFDPLDESLIAGKDFPFPPNEEADATPDDDSSDDGSSSSDPQDDGQDGSEDSQDNNKAGKDFPFPQSQK